MHEPLTIVVDSEVWDLYVFAVTKIERDWWVQMAVVGPRACRVTVRVDSSSGRGAAAHQIVKLVSEWLRSEDASDHAFLEHPAMELRAS